MREKLRVPAALLGAGVAGMLVAIQSRINGGLSQELGNGFMAAVISFGVGLLFAGVVFLFAGQMKPSFQRLQGELKSGRFPKWALFGGAAGAVFVLGQSFVAPVVGVALFTVGVVAGQVLGGLVIDMMGLGPAGRVKPTPMRLVGTGLAIAAVVISVSGSFTGGFSAGTLLLVIVPFVAGVAVAWQSAVNGLLRVAMHSVVSATFVSFFVGTVILAVLAVVSVAVNGWPEQWPTAPYLYVGGFIGVIFIAVLAMLVKIAGVLLVGMSNVAGQLVASMLLELGVPLAGGMTTGLLVGALVALLAVVVAALPTRPKAS